MIDGTWKPVGGEIDGLELADDYFSDDLVLSEGNYVFGNDRGRYTVDTTTEPPSIDVRGEKGPNAGKLLPGIFELDGTTLRICYDLAGAGRPVKLETTPGSRRFLVTYAKS